MQRSLSKSTIQWEPTWKGDILQNERPHSGEWSIPAQDQTTGHVSEAIVDFLSPASSQLLGELSSQGQMEQKSRPADPSWPGELCKIINHCFKFEVACYGVIDHGNKNTSKDIYMVSIFLKPFFIH